MLLFFPYQPTPWFSEDTNWVSNSLIQFDTNHLESAQTPRMKGHARLRMPVPSMWALERWPVCMCACCRSAVFDSLRHYGLWTARLLCPWNFPGKNTGVALPFPPSGPLPNFPTPGSSPHLLHLLIGRRLLYCWATWEVPGTNTSVQFCCKVGGTHNSSSLIIC